MELICLDIEATGLNHETEDIIEVAAVKFNLLNDQTETYHSLVATDIEIPNLIENLTGINNDMLKDAPQLNNIKQDIINFCGDLPIVGHNIQFDTGFLREKGIDLPGTEIDTLPLSQAILKYEPSFSLEILCQKYNQTTQPSHRALDDVLANIELLKILIQKLNQLPQANLQLLKETLQKANHPLSSILLEVLQTNSEDKQELSFQSPSLPEKLPKLTVQNTDLLDPTEHPNILPKPNTLLDQTQLLQNLQALTPEELDPNLDSAIKVILKLNPSHLTLPALNHRGELPHFIKSTRQQGTQIPFQADNYISNYHTFFELYKSKQTDRFEEITILPDPYLVEGYLYTKEVKINLDNIQNKPEEEITLLKTFNQLQEFLHQNVQDPNSTYKYHVLDMFQKSDQEFQQMIKSLSELTQNTQTKSQLQVFSKLQSQYYIWLEQYQDYPVQLKAIPKDTLINQKDILSHLEHPNLTLPTKRTSSSTTLQTVSHQADTRTQEYTNFIIHYLRENYMDITHTGLVISPTKHIIKQIHEELSLEFKDQGITLLSQDITGSKGKILQLLESNESPTILVCTHHFLLKFQPELAKLEKAVLTKLPIGLPAHKIYRILEKEDENSFGNLVIPQTGTTIAHILDLLERKYQLHQLDNLDYRINSTGWGRKIGDNI